MHVLDFCCAQSLGKYMKCCRYGTIVIKPLLKSFEVTIVKKPRDNDPTIYISANFGRSNDKFTEYHGDLFRGHMCRMQIMSRKYPSKVFADLRIGNVLSSEFAALFAKCGNITHF